MRKVNCFDAEGMSFALSTRSGNGVSFLLHCFYVFRRRKKNETIRLDLLVFLLHILLRSEKAFPAVTKASNDVRMCCKIE